MGRAPAGSAWITIINNLNIVAVATFANVACIIIAHGIKPDQRAVEKANELCLPILLSKEPAFETGQIILEKIK